MATRGYERSIPEIISDLLTQFPMLLRKESQLARVEMSEKLSQIALGIGFVVFGAVLLIPAIVILFQAAVAALQRAGVQMPAAALIVGGIAFVVGLILLLIGIGRMKVRNLLPDRTISQVQQDAMVAKQQVRPGDDYQRAA
ncbi:MAG TPA: phage holin family protein [Pseudolabrys sp.]|nr:phage holin family protein [Pseudolabrys sp.]